MSKETKLYRTKGRNHYLPKYDNGKVNYRWNRNKKTVTDSDGNFYREGDTKMTRHNGQKDGYDYTPLYQYLIKAVGRDFDEVCSEVYPRIEDRSKIWDIVEKHATYTKDNVVYYALNDAPVNPIVHNAFHHYYGTQEWSALYVDDNNKLQFVNKDYLNYVFGRTCDWETVTVNGKQYNKSNKQVYV